MRTKLCSGRLLVAAGTTALLGVLLSSSLAQADDTGWISPNNENGNYTQWFLPGFATSNNGSYVNDGIGCASVDLNSWWFASFSNVRASAIITIPGTIPDGSTIDSVDAQACQGRANTGADGATFQTFIRVDGSDIDSGSNIVAATPFDTPTAPIQNIPVGVVMSGPTFAALEIGTLKTNATVAQRIYTLAARINYTLPASVITISCDTPVEIGNDSPCTATVAPSAGANIASGDIDWSSADGTFSAANCTLVAGECGVTFTPSGVGSSVVMVAYAGDTNMTGNDNTTTVQVSPPQGAVQVPALGPIALLLTMFGIGVIGARQTRRKTLKG